MYTTNVHCTAFLDVYNETLPYVRTTRVGSAS